MSDTPVKLSIEQKIVFALSPDGQGDGVPMPILGVPAAAWDYMKDGMRLFLRLGAAFVAPNLGKPQTFRLGIHPFEHGDSEIQQIFRILLSEGSVVRAIVTIFTDAFGKLFQLSRQLSAIQQPIKSGGKVAASSSVQSGRELRRKQGFRSKIDRQPKHCSSSVPRLHRHARRGLTERIRDLFVRVFRRGNSRPVRKVEIAVHFEIGIKRALEFFRARMFRPLIKFYFALRDNERRRFTAVSAHRKDFEPILPAILSGEENAVTCIERHIARATPRTVSHQLSHFQPHLERFKAWLNLPRILSLVERATP